MFWIYNIWLFQYNGIKYIVSLEATLTVENKELIRFHETCKSSLLICAPILFSIKLLIAYVLISK